MSMSKSKNTKTSCIYGAFAPYIKDDIKMEEPGTLFVGSVRNLQKIINDRGYQVVGEFGEEGKQKIKDNDVYVAYNFILKGNVAHIKKQIVSIGQLEGRQTRLNTNNIA